MDDVLAALNRFRKEHFDLEPLEELPTGRKCVGDHCPLARTLPAGWVVSSRNALGPDDETTIPLPAALQAFVVNFDRGAYPELVER